MQQIRRFVAVAILVLVSEFTQGQLFADQKLPEGLFIQGYAGRLSYVPDEEVTLHLNSSGGQCSLTVERVGAERQRVFAQDNIAVATHPIPDRASSHGCGWPEAFRFTIPNDWTSGYYEVKLSVSNSGDAAAGKEANKTASSLFFVVRRHHTSKRKFCCSFRRTRTTHTRTGVGTACTPTTTATAFRGTVFRLNARCRRSSITGSTRSLSGQKRMATNSIMR
ncbi:MAG: hypothetical protein KDA69_18635 [Planctomycetaceae bacterium]|nr:hypothetical protein [Planctomycetaceae bacterium]